MKECDLIICGLWSGYRLQAASQGELRSSDLALSLSCFFITEAQIHGKSTKARLAFVF